VDLLALERTLTELDHVRILNLVRRYRRVEVPAAPRLPIEDVLDTCSIVPSRQAPPDVVTMYTQVALRDVESGESSKVALCYPADAEPTAGFVSVLSPIGAGLLGLGLGAIAHWRTPAGEERVAEIVAILFQPESSGDYTT
jgi:regulator of nucleoside diphosphate kinase